MSRPPMGADPATRGPSVRSLRRAGAVVLGLVVMGIGIVLTGPAADDTPLDPASPAGDGLLGLVRVLEDLGVQVEVSARPPDDTATRVFVAVDEMAGDARAELVAFAEAGGTVVVAGSSPELHGLALEGGSPIDAIGRTARSPECDALGEVGAVFQNRWATLEVPPEATACFAVGESDAWLVSVPTGAGTVIALGSAQPFTNALLDEADNAVLAAALLGPEPGARLVVVPRSEVGEDDTVLLDLVPDGFFRALWLLLAAVLTFVLWRARRLGPPVVEQLPPVLPSAELARSVAGLLQRAGNRAAAGARLREDVRREVRHALRLPAGTPSTRLAELAPRRSGVTDEDARLVLLDAPVEDDGALTELAAAAARLRAGLRRAAPVHPEAARP